MDQLGWALGRDVYSAQTFGYDVLPSLHLAEALRPYPRSRAQHQPTSSVRADRGRLAPRPCRARDLTATYTLIPFSAGAGSVAYQLTVRNRSRSGCAVTVPLGMRLLDRHRDPLPTRASFFPTHPYRVTLAAGRFTQAQAKLSPDVAALGEPGVHCEPTAHWLALLIRRRRVLAPMDPTEVCQYDAMYFDRLRPVVAPRCTGAMLSAAFTRLGQPQAGEVDYRLGLRNTQAHRCFTSSIPGLRLLTATGSRLPTHVLAGIRSPYGIAARAPAVALATLYTTPGPSGPCEPLASRILIYPGSGGGAVSAAIRPPLRACHRGAIVLSGLIECCLGDAGHVRAVTEPARAPSFSPLIRTVMDQLSRLRLTRAPLTAPAGPLGPLSVEIASGLGGWFQATGGWYQVHVGLCPDLYPPPRPHQAVAPRGYCGGSIAQLVSGFSYGGRRHPSRAAALAALRLPRPRGRPHRVALGYGVVGEAYPGGGGLIGWTLRGWRLRADYSACLASDVDGDTFAHLTLPAARQIVAFVHAHPLPRARGRALFRGSCGDPSSATDELDWALTREVYSAETFGYDLLPSLRLAEAMQRYPRPPAVVRADARNRSRRERLAAPDPSRLPGRPGALVMLSDRVVLVAAGGQLYRSADGGRSWRPLVAHCMQAQMVGQPCGYHFSGFAVLRGGTVVVAADDSPSVWSSTDQGLGWRHTVLSRPVSAIGPPGAAGPWSAHGAGYLLLQPSGIQPHPAPAPLERSVDGRTWTRIAMVPSLEAHTNGVLDGLTVLGPRSWIAEYRFGDCTLPSNLAATFDGGRRSRTVFPPITDAVPVATSPRDWFVAGSCQAGAPAISQGVFATRDAGHSWQPAVLRAGRGPLQPGQVFFAPSPGRPATGRGYELDLASITCPDARHGIAVGGYRTFDATHGYTTSRTLGSVLLITADGGTIWKLDSLPGGPALNLISCADAEHCLAAATGSRTLAPVRLG